MALRFLEPKGEETGGFFRGAEGGSGVCREELLVFFEEPAKGNVNEIKYATNER